MTRRVDTALALVLLGASMLLSGCRAEDNPSAQPPPPTDETHARAEDERPAQVHVELGLVDDAAREALAARLRPDSAVAPLLEGGPLLAVHHHVIDGWHIYWRNPGESGLKTRLSLEADGVGFGPVLYPAPDRFTADGGQVSYGWGHEAVLFVPLAQIAGARFEDASITVRSDYLACASSCVPGHAEITTTIAALETSTSEATQQMLDRVPEPAGDRVAASWSEHTLRLSTAPELGLAELFPYALDTALLEGQRASEAGGLELDYRFTGPAPADQGQGVLRSTIAGETRYLELAVPWPAS